MPDPKRTTPRPAERHAAGLLAVVGALAWSQPLISGAELWWHLAAGRAITAAGGIPAVDPYSHTAAESPWLNHEWLWGLAAWELWELEPQSVAWLSLAVLALLFALVYRNAHRLSGSPGSALLATWGAAATAHWFFEIRPQSITRLFAVIVLATRSSRAALFLWPVLLALWANLHGGWVFGIGLVALSTLVATAEQSFAAGRLALPRRDWWTLGLCGAALLVNPYGPELLAYPFTYADPGGLVHTLVEWRSPGFGLDPATYRGRFWIFAAVSLVGAGLVARRDPVTTAAAVAALVMAATSLRFISLFAVVAAPLVAVAIAAALRAAARRWSALDARAVRAAVLVTAALAAALLWRDVRLVPNLLYRWTDAAYSPQGAVRYLGAFDRSMRLYNEMLWGGYVSLYAPPLRIFYDGRTNTVYDEATIADFLRIQVAAPGYRQLLREHRVDAALLYAASPLAAALQDTPDAWRLVYRDDVAAVLVPPDSDLLRMLPSGVERLAGTPELLTIAAGERLAAGDASAARELLERAVRLEPLYVPAWVATMRIAAPEGPDAIAAVAERAIRAYPRAAPRIRGFEAETYESIGEPARALATLRRAHLGGPSIYDDGIDASVARLERQLRAP